MRPKELVEAMSRHYRKLNVEELVQAQEIDKEIAHWARKDFEADMAIAGIMREVHERLKRLAKSNKDDLAEIKDIAALLKFDPEMSMSLIKKFFKPQYGKNWEADHYDKLVVKYNEVREAGLVAQEKVYELNQQYTNWRRFWLVPGGHLHDEYRCSTCHKMGKITQMDWVWDLSGLTLEAAVDKYGKIICSVCYPEAPTDWSSQVEGQKAKEELRCSGSGKRDPDANFDSRRRTNYGTCPDCTGRFVINPGTFLLRAHKPYIDPYCEGSKLPPSEVTEKNFKGRCSVCNKIKYLSGVSNVVERHNKPKVKVTS